MFTNVLLVAAGVVSGVVLALKVIAPMTSTKVDDEVLTKLASLEEMLKKVTGQA